jgi:murein DD-endopeptidase MepM/ murein hydrolase activator NlpD
MPIREKFPKAQLPRSHYFFSIGRGDSLRTFALRPLTLWAIIALLPLSLLWGGGATLYLAFHDEMLGIYLTHQIEMRNAYEDRIAEARAELDRVASRQLLDQNSFEGKVHDLLLRQAQLEQRGSLVASLATQVAEHDLAMTAEIRPHPAAVKVPVAALNAIEAVSRTGPSDSVIGAATRAFAPLPIEIAPPVAPKPRPVEEPRDYVSVLPKSEADHASADLAAAASNPDLDASARLGLIAYSLDRVERGQLATLGQVATVARDAVAHLSAVVAKTGLSMDNLSAHEPKGGVGGPFIPVSDDPAAPAFDTAVSRAAREIALADRLRRLMPFMPVRRPLFGEASVSSPFGYRPDPFLGRPALHPGVDLVQAFGAEIYSTAAGRVVHAGPFGGYGNMVEVDHGNGLATRYGHMSEVLVTEGQEVKAGAVLGRIGSTGRSTGPHLHYEVRVNDEPVDPERFLEAGAEMFAAQ